jgi:hypothetical protein
VSANRRERHLDGQDKQNSYEDEAKFARRDEHQQPRTQKRANN